MPVMMPTVTDTRLNNQSSESNDCDTFGKQVYTLIVNVPRMLKSDWSVKECNILGDKAFNI